HFPFSLLSRSHHPPHLPSFPTRRSSDLGDMIPVQIDVAEEVGRARRIMSDGIVPDGFLEKGEVDRVESTLSAQKRQAPIPSDRLDRKSTRLNSSHVSISYAVFCLKKKKH